MSLDKQVDLWSGSFGRDYVERTANQLSEDALRRLTRDWGRILRPLVAPPPQSILEVGCNIGRNLAALRPFAPELYGIEPNGEVCALASQNPMLQGVEVKQGTGADLPFGDDAIDLVFTSGVLIHVSPENLPAVTDEIVRVSRRYVLCIEYFSHKPEAVEYHGMQGYLWKRDFGRYYMERYEKLRVVDYGFLWEPIDSSDNSNWWLFEKR